MLNFVYDLVDEGYQSMAAVQTGNRNVGDHHFWANGNRVDHLLSNAGTGRRKSRRVGGAQHNRVDSRS